MTYRIEIYYRTGDSFNSENIYDMLEPVWENLDIVKENLQRIKLHYSYYYFRNNNCRYNKKLLKLWTDKPVPDFIVEDRHLINLKLKLDNRKEYQFYPPYCGYFEELYWAKVVLQQNEELMITPDLY